MRKLICSFTVAILIGLLISGCVNISESDPVVLDILGFNTGTDGSDVTLTVEATAGGSVTIFGDSHFDGDRYYRTTTKNAVNPLGTAVDFETEIVDAIEVEPGIFRDAKLVFNGYDVPLDNIVALGDGFAAQDNIEQVIDALQADIDAVFSDPTRFKAIVSEHQGSPGYLAITGQTMATVTATADEGHTFLGWYSGDELLSSETEYNFVIVQTLALEARFQEDQLPVTGTNVNYLMLLGLAMISLGLSAVWLRPRTTL